MIRKNQARLNLFNMMTDGLLTLMAYFLSFFLRHDVMGGLVSVEMREGMYIALALAYCIVIVTAYYVLHVYSPQRMKAVGENTLRIVMVNTFGVMALMTVFYLMKIVDVSRLALLLFWMLSSVLVSAKHMALHTALRIWRAKGYNQKHFVIVGNGHLALQYVEDIKRDAYRGVVVDGYVSASKKAELGKCLGTYEQLEEILADGDYDGIVVALEPHEIHFMKQVLQAADKEGLFVQMIPFFNDYYPAHPTFDLIGRTKLINLRATPLDNLGNAMIKRAVDFLGSLVLIVLTSPIMLAVAIGVKLSSPGPVIFSQQRIGKDRKPFNMHKFRSMRMDVDHEGWSTDNDPRKTRFGSFIRKWSLDELPQLFDVLVGHMSLVGPRPEIPRFVRQFKEEVPLYLVRQQVRPGMTGWAQVHGLRGDTSIEERVKYDIWYIENWSLMLDIRILLRTALGGMKNNERIIDSSKAA